jgi:hypothetical protein
MVAVIVFTGPPLGPEIVKGQHILEALGDELDDGQVALLKLPDECFDAPDETLSLRSRIDFVQLDDQTVRDEISANARRHAAAIPDAQLVAVFEGPVRHCGEGTF